MKETINCKQCRKSTTKYNQTKSNGVYYDVKTKPRLFCSKACATKYRKTNQVINCIKCGIQTTRDKYCINCYEQSYTEVNNRWNKNDYDTVQKPIAQKLKRILVSILGGKCSYCNYRQCLCSLTFHHTNPKDKSFTLDTRNIYKKDIILVLDELDKCELLCQNCHCIEHQTTKTQYSKQYAKRMEIYKSRKLELMKRFNNQCQECNFTFNTFNLSCAEFHHIGEKLFHLSARELPHRTIEEINSEVAKCTLLCKNCHVAHHYK